MEDGLSGYFILWDTVNSKAKVDNRAAFESNFGMHFQGDNTPVGWKGGFTSTTASQAWTENLAFHSEAHICGVDATGIPFLVLSLDLRQTYSLGPKFSWFRVLVNGEQIPDNHGVLDFNPESMANDAWKHLYFDLSAYSGSVFDITLQSATRFSDKAQGEGDNVFIDNIGILNTTFTDLPITNDPIFTISPNPSDGKIKVKGTYSDKEITVKVYSLTGTIVYSYIFNTKDGVIEKDLDLSFLPSGVYALSLTGKQKNFNKRFVIR
jgi:hypothetical protein